MIPFWRGLLLFLPVLLPTFGLSACTRTVRPREESEKWHRLLLNGVPAGFHREIERRLPSGNTATLILERVVVRRAGQAMDTEMEGEVEETPRGEIARFRLVQRLGNADTVTEGTVEGESMELVVTGAGNPRRSTIPHNPRALGPRALERLLREKLRRAGDSAAAVVFFPEKVSSGRFTASLGPEETVEFPGGSRKLTRRTSRTEVLPGVDLHEWIDGEGEVWKSSTHLMGMTIETYRSSAEEILAEKYASPPEVFLSSSIIPDRPLRDPLSLEEAVYRFTLKSGDFRSRGIEAMFQGTGQTLVREEGPAARVVRIRKILPGRGVSRPVSPPPGMEETLAPNVFIQSDDPLIGGLAAEATRGESDAFLAARKLEAWVRANVRFKDLKVLFASAKEVAQRREGDCTEHGVLLTALARASGIPARVASGLVYHEGSFVGHLWTEVFIDRWVPLDGSRGYGEVGPDHIALSTSSLSTSSAADLFFDLAHVIGNLKIEILEERGK